MKKFTKIAVFLLTLILAFGTFVGCTTKPSGPVTPGGDDDVKAENPETPGTPYGAGRTLTIFLWGDKPAGIDDVIAEFKRQTSDRFAFDVQFMFSPIDDYKSSLTMNISSASNIYDLVFDAPWIYLQEWAQKGNYVKLDKYFENENFPGLNKAFSSSFLKNNKFNNGLYGIPLTETFGSTNAAYYREDWRKEAANAGVESLADGIDGEADVDAYLNWVKANKPGVTPLIANKDGFGPYNIAAGFYDAGDGLTIEQTNRDGVRVNWPIYPGSDITFSAYVDPDSKTVKSAYMPQYESTAARSAFPTKYQSDSAFLGNWEASLNKVREWGKSGIMSNSIANETDAISKFRNGQAGMVVSDITQFVSHQTALRKQDPNAELEIYIYSKQEREFTQPNWGTDYKAWNYLSIPKTSKNEDLAILFMNWLFESRENHDLFQYGVEGKHWTKVDPTDGSNDYRYIVNETHESYTLNPYLLTWNMTYLRKPEGISQLASKYLDYVNDEESFVEYLYGGFEFNYQTVSSELSNPDFGVYPDEIKAFYLGTEDNPVQKFQQKVAARLDNRKFQDDLAIIKGEFLTQLQDYIDANY